jgi:hypothetical protein
MMADVEPLIRGSNGLAEVEKPLLIMIDLSMTGEVGRFSAAEKIVKKGPLPILMLTVNADTRTFERGRIRHVLHLPEPLQPPPLGDCLASL